MRDESEANPYLTCLPTKAAMLTIFQHGKDEPLGEIGVYLKKKEVPHTIIHLFEQEDVPAVLPAKLIVLGGQMSVNDTGLYPFLNAEKQIIRSMIDKGRPVLGICLGAQLIASSFGQMVYPEVQEHGWFCVRGCGPGNRSLFPDSFPIFHWHNETFDLPEGAQLLAYGERVKNQAFRFGSAVGVQFHPEVTASIISRWSQEMEDTLKAVVSAHTEKYLGSSNHMCHNLTQGFLRVWKP